MADYAISNVVRRVVYTNTGVGPYAFTFEVLANTDIAVYRGSTLLTLTTDYTVIINANGTGSVTLVTAGTGNITIVGSRAIQRTSDYTTGGDLFASTLNTDLDSQTIYAQQVAETAERGLKAPVTDPTDIAMTLPAKASRAGKVLAFDSTTGNPVAGPALDAVTTVIAQSANINTVADNIASVNTVAGNTANINTVAGNNSNITTVAGVSANVTTVAGISSNVTTVAGNNANVSTVAGISGNVTTVAGISANVTTVAGISADVSTVSTNNANVTTVATNIASVNTNATNIVAIQNASTNATNAANSATAAANSATAAQNAQTAAEAARDTTLAAFDSFDDRYLGSKTSNPTLDNDGNALAAGALYFNSVAGEMRVYTGSAWVAAYVSGTGFLSSANNLSDVASVSTARTNLGLAIGTNVQAYDANLTSLSNRGLFKKTDSTIVGFTKTGAGTATTSSIIYVDVNGSIKTIASGTSITMPTFAAGTDYAIWAKTDGTLEATSNHTSPPTANARKIGGFHYAAGGNATAQSGGNTTPQINEYSFWDLKWRPACNDPRGMTLVADGFWADIYLANTDCDANGTSKYNVTIGDGSSPPKVPTKFGGNGSTTYGSLTWFESCELASAYGKRLLTQREFMAMAYGTTEASSIGSDQGSTILNAAYTSKWGVMQSAGVMWVWGDDRAGPFASAAWNANTEGRGSEYNAPNAVILGGNWGDGANAGSRCSSWSLVASISSSSVGVRFSCDHLLLD